MDLDAIVNAIVGQVVRRLKEEGFALPVSSVRRPCVMVLADRDDPAALRVAEALNEPGDPAVTDLLFLGEDAGGRKPARHILPFLSCSDMADLAAGRASGPAVSAALGLLLAGEPVEVMEFEYKAYERSAPAALYRLYEGYEKTLAAYGMAALARKMPEVLRLRDDLVTEQSVSRAAECGALTLLVPPAAIVTPLARDAAKSLNVNIIKGL